MRSLRAERSRDLQGGAGRAAVPRSRLLPARLGRGRAANVRLDELVTTKRELALDQLLDEDSTFYGDLFPHAVQWHGDIYLEDGLHRALRAALQSGTRCTCGCSTSTQLRPGQRAPPSQRRSGEQSRTTASASSRPRWVSTTRPSGERACARASPHVTSAAALRRAPVAARRRIGRPVAQPNAEHDPLGQAGIGVEGLAPGRRAVRLTPAACA